MSAGDFNVGEVVDGKFRLVALLGEGAMGRVFEAHHLFMNRRVAVKLLTRETMRSTTAFQRFQQEALAASSIAHRHIVTVLDFGVDHDSGVPYVVQEFLDGMTLQDYLATSPGGKLPPQETVEIMAPVMAALAAAHRLGIVHRDVKPANIFLTRGEGGGTIPKVIDFGVAKALRPLMEDAARTRDGQPVGTPAYMAREQAAGLVEIDARADVWAAGVVLFELLTGRRPYEAPNANLLLMRVMTEAPPPLASVAPLVPASLCAAVDGALQPDREQRHASMGAFLDALLGAVDADVATRIRASLDAGAPPPRPSLSTPSVPPRARQDDRGDDQRPAPPHDAGNATLAPTTTLGPAERARASVRRGAIVAASTLLVTVAIAWVVVSSPPARRHADPPAARGTSHGPSHAPATPQPVVAVPIVPLVDASAGVLVLADVPHTPDAANADHRPDATPPARVRPLTAHPPRPRGPLLRLNVIDPDREEHP